MVVSTAVEIGEKHDTFDIRGLTDARGLAMFSLDK